MNILLLLIPVSLGISTLFLLLFRWAVRNRQFQDLETPAVRILTSQKRTPPPRRSS